MSDIGHYAAYLILLRIIGGMLIGAALGAVVGLLLCWLLL